MLKKYYISCSVTLFFRLSVCECCFVVYFGCCVVWIFLHSILNFSVSFLGGSSLTRSHKCSLLCGNLFSGKLLPRLSLMFQVSCQPNILKSWFSNASIWGKNFTRLVSNVCVVVHIPIFPELVRVWGCAIDCLGLKHDDLRLWLEFLFVQSSEYFASAVSNSSIGTFTHTSSIVIPWVFVLSEPNVGTPLSERRVNPWSLMNSTRLSVMLLCTKIWMVFQRSDFRFQSASITVGRRSWGGGNQLIIGVKLLNILKVPGIL